MAKAGSLNLVRLVSKLPQPTHPLQGLPPSPLVLPRNVVCFRRVSAAKLNQPRVGRTLHHRCVLIFALRTAATVRVDDRGVRLNPGHALLILPFQFHHYSDAERESLEWLFITFELSETEPLEALRFRPFRVAPDLRRTAAELVQAYQRERRAELPVLLLALLLARIRRMRAGRGVAAPPPEVTEPGLLARVNQLALRTEAPAGTREIARALGISPSHLRARFRASCGVSLGKHLRRLRLEHACGLLRLGTQRVSEVAEACGFASIHSFSRAFRRAYGVPPLTYRHRGRRVRRRAPAEAGD
jgi:AraC-like DNA-binding protein